MAMTAAPAQGATEAVFVFSVGSCEMSTTLVFCDTSSNPGFSARLNRRGHVKICRGIMCLGDPGENDPLLKPGHSRRVGRFRCTAHTHSVTCKVIRTGKGFRMSAKRVVRVG
jgi:hypothetical protein